MKGGKLEIGSHFWWQLKQQTQVNSSLWYSRALDQFSWTVSRSEISPLLIHFTHQSTNLLWFDSILCYRHFVLPINSVIASHLLVYPLHIPHLECVWPSQWSQPAHGQQGHKGSWVSAGLCQAAGGRAWQITFLALPLGGGTQWCWRNLCDKNDTKQWINDDAQTKTAMSIYWSTDIQNINPVIT